MGAEAAAIQHVADRFLVRLAAQEACRITGMRLASAGLTPEVVAAFGEHFYLPMHEGRVAFGNLVRKLKKLVDGFKHVPKLWDKFKKTIGVESLTDLPGAIKRLANLAVKALRSLLAKLFNTWPLKLYTLEKGKLADFNTLIEKLISKSPKLKQILSSAVTKIGDFGEMVRQYAPHIVGTAMVAIYVWVWFNVVEFEWNLKGLVDAVTGAMTFPQFLASLPGSAFGFLLTFFGFGTFTFIPISIVARILWLMNARYVTWTGKFQVDWTRMKEDFALDLSGLGGDIGRLR